MIEKEISYKEAGRLAAALKETQQLRLPVPVALAIGRWLKAWESEFSLYVSERKKILERFGKQVSTSTYEVPADNKEECERDLKTLDEQVVKLPPLYPVRVEDGQLTAASIIVLNEHGLLSYSKDTQE